MLIKQQKEKLGEDIKHMDIFDVLKAMMKRKIEIMREGMSEKEALVKAKFYISGEYHIPVLDIEKLYRIEPYSM